MAGPWGTRFRSQGSMMERLSPREWLRMYRTLGLAEDASKAQVTKAASRLRRKYAEDEARRCPLLLGWVAGGVAAEGGDGEPVDHDEAALGAGGPRIRSPVEAV